MPIVCEREHAGISRNKNSGRNSDNLFPAVTSNPVMPMNRRHFIVGAVLVAVLTSGAFSSLFAAEKAKPGKPHTILSCNIRVDVPADRKTGDNWDARKDLCADVIRAQKPDIVCLQECHTKAFADLLQRLPGYATYGLANPTPEYGYSPNNPILYSAKRYTLITCGGFWLSETPHLPGSKSWDSAVVRFVNWVELKDRASGQVFRVWNSHLDHLGAEARRQGAKLIVEAAAAMPKGLPQVFTADANCKEDSAPMQNFFSAGWTNTYAVVHGPEDPGYTFHGFKGKERFGPNPTPEQKGKRIDWILTHGPITTTDAGILRDSRKGHYPSDHYFMSATIQLDAVK